MEDTLLALCATIQAKRDLANSLKRSFPLPYIHKHVIFFSEDKESHAVNKDNSCMEWLQIK